MINRTQKNCAIIGNANVKKVNDKMDGITRHCFHYWTDWIANKTRI